MPCVLWKWCLVGAVTSQLPSTLPSVSCVLYVARRRFFLHGRGTAGTVRVLRALWGKLRHPGAAAFMICHKSSAATRKRSGLRGMTCHVALPPFPGSRSTAAILGEATFAFLLAYRVLWRPSRVHKSRAEQRGRLRGHRLRSAGAAAPRRAVESHIPSDTH
jgi:hypothetical protein